MITLILLLAFFTINPPEVHAYLDPGTGSYIFQILIASIIGAVAMLKPKTSIITTLIKKIFKKKTRSLTKNEK